MNSECLPIEETLEERVLNDNVTVEFMSLILQMGKKEIHDIWTEYKKTRDVSTHNSYLFAHNQSIGDRNGNSTKLLLL